MSTVIDTVLTTSPVPAGRPQSKYLNLRAPLSVDDDEVQVRCFQCDNVIMSVKTPQTARGLALRCPFCRTISKL